MKIARFLARETATVPDQDGHNYALVSWAGSARSMQEATDHALAKLEVWKRRLRSGESPGEYYVDNGDIREQLIDEFTDADGNLVLAVTRNRYGALVLNSANVLFADVDLPIKVSPARAGWARFVAGIFGGGKAAREREQVARAALREEHMQRFAQFHEANPALAFRVYETFAGFRILMTNRLYDADNAETRSLLEALGSDPLYMTLCRVQQCFRARLTPKPWRCGMSGAPGVHPREGGIHNKFSRWERRYAAASAKVGVCRLVECFGPESTTDLARQVVDLHDRYVLNGKVENLA